MAYIKNVCTKSPNAKRLTWFCSLLLIFVISCSCSTSGPREIVVLSYGGDFADAQRHAYFKPFTENTGILVREATYNGEYGKVKVAVESGNVPWDVVDVESSMLVRGRNDKILSPLDYSKIDTSSLLQPGVQPEGLATDFYSVSLGYNSQVLTGNKPRNWADFWNVKQYPGSRCLKRDPRFTLEIALMADGVPLNQVYTSAGLDVDRAFRSLDRIKPYVKVWWTSGQQPIELLSTGEVSMAAAFGARIFNASQGGRPVKVSWDQGILDIEYWVIPRGSKHQAESLQFIGFASRPDRQADFVGIIPLGPVNNQTFSLITPARAEALNTYPDNYSKQLLLSTTYWAQNEATLRERFDKWLLQ